MSGNIVHIRHVANTLMTTYGRGAPSKLEFHPNLKSIFRYNIFDPIRLTPYKYRFNNYCVLISIIIQLEYITTGSLKTLKKQKIRNLLQHLNNGNFIFDDEGVTMEQFNAIEDDKDLFNKLKQLYPILSKFEGLSINLFACQHSNNLRAFHLIPIRLGKWHFSSHLNIDLLKDSKDIRPPPRKSKKKNSQSDNSELTNYFKHVLVILNFIRLHQTFRNFSQHHLMSLHDTEICRR